MKKRTVFVFVVLLAFMQHTFAQKIELPFWALNPKEGEFVGISLPGGDQMEAECMALYAISSVMNPPYLYQNLSEYYQNGEDLDVHKISTKEISYTVKKVEYLPTKEVIVLLSHGQERKGKLSVVEEYYVKDKFERIRFALRFEDSAQIQVDIGITQSTVNNLSREFVVEYKNKGRDASNSFKTWFRKNGLLTQKEGYNNPTSINNYKFCTVNSKTYIEREVNSFNMSFSECMWRVLLEASKWDPYIVRGFGLKGDHFVLYTKFPSFSTILKNSKPVVESLVNDWQKKRRYEKTESYLRRVTSETRQDYVDSLLGVIKERYIADDLRRVESTQHIVNYDADNEVFFISDSKYGDLLVHVPIEVAPDFEKKFDDVSIEDCKYDIINDRVCLVEAVYKMPDGSKYDYKNDAQLQYAELDINYNFEPIDFNLNIAKSGFADNIGNQSARKKNLTVGLSDVDIEIPVTDRKENNTFVVIIANENYDTESNVDYALNDGNVFKKYCVRTLGIPEENISFVENATLNNIRAQIDMLTNIGMAYNGDVKLIFYYAGHGIPDESSKDAYLLPVDGYGNNAATGYKLSELYSQLSEIQSISTTVFLDACFSGADRNDEMLVSARGVAIKTNPEVPDGNLVIFSAAQSDQTAMAYKEKGHGMFTYFLLKKLRETKGNVTLGELEEYITDSVRKLSATPRYNKPQIPAVTVGSSVGSSWRSMRL